MHKYSNIAMVASFFGLWLDSYLSDSKQIYLGFFLIFTFGILHGANDLMLIKTIKNDEQKKSWLKVLSYYIVVVLCGIALFYLIPQLALLLFIVVSAYHFGEQEWQQTLLQYGKWFTFAFQIIYGLLILSLLFIFHKEQVQEIIINICQLKVPTTYFDLLFGIVLALFLSLCSVVYLQNKNQIQNILQECFYILLYAIIFKSSSLIWGFAIYFVIWHSIPSIMDQIRFLDGTYTTTNFINYCKNAALYWFISIMGIASIYYFFSGQEQLFNALFFSFLAAITFPHAAVISTMFHHSAVIPKK